MDTVIQELVPLYHPNERFEISADGLDEWQRSVSFKRTTPFYLSYPARSLLGHATRAVLLHLLGMRPPRVAPAVGTYWGRTSGVVAPPLGEPRRVQLATG